MSDDIQKAVDNFKKLTKLSYIPTLPSHKNYCPAAHCIAWTFPLSSFTKYYGELNYFPVYSKVTKFKCDNGHIIEREYKVDMDGNKL